MEYHKGDKVKVSDYPPPDVDNVCWVAGVPGDLRPQEIDGMAWRLPGDIELTHTMDVGSYMLMDEVGRCRLYRHSLIELVERVDYRREFMKMKEELGV